MLKDIKVDKGRERGSMRGKCERKNENKNFCFMLIFIYYFSIDRK